MQDAVQMHGVLFLLENARQNGAKKIIFRIEKDEAMR